MKCSVLLKAQTQFNAEIITEVLCMSMINVSIYILIKFINFFTCSNRDKFWWTFLLHFKLSSIKCRYKITSKFKFLELDSNSYSLVNFMVNEIMGGNLKTLSFKCCWINLCQNLSNCYCILDISMRMNLIFALNDKRNVWNVKPLGRI